MLYRLYIDECGTDDVVSCHIAQHRHLAVTGVIMAVPHVTQAATPGLNALKLQHFPHVDPDGPPLVLHRSDYLAAKGEFGCLSDPGNMQNFCNDLHAYLQGLDHCVITVVLDKEAMLRKAHWRNKEPYHYCSEVLVEKYVQYLERVGARGDVFAESRKNNKNKALQSAFSRVCQNGTRYVEDPARIAATLTTDTIKFRGDYALDIPCSLGH